MFVLRFKNVFGCISLPQIIKTFKQVLNRSSYEKFKTNNIYVVSAVVSSSAVFLPESKITNNALKRRQPICRLLDLLSKVLELLKLGCSFYLFFLLILLMNEIVVATRLPHKREGFLLSAFLKGTTSKLADFFSHYFFIY